MVKRAYVWGLISGLMLAGCAGFSYKYYGLQLEVYKGRMLGPIPSDDHDFAECAPSSGSKSPCIAMFTHDFLNLKNDYQDCKDRLISCQRGQ